MQKFLTILTLCAALIASTACKDQAETTVSDTNSPNPLIVIGIDGATWDVIDPMIAKGELPNMARLRDTGAWGPLITVGPQVSPVVWSSFSTGQFGRQHGILDFVYPYKPGPKRPVQSTERQSPALWNLVSDAGKEISVVGYFVTYPSEKINGTMVSYQSPQKQPGADYPEGALEPIREDLDSIKANREDRTMLWSRFLPWDFDPRNEPAADDPTAEAFRMVKGRVERRILHAEYNRRAALYLAGFPHDVFINYFGLVDYASHSLWKYYDDTDFEVKADPETKRLLANVIPETYRYMDEFIGELLAKSPENANVVIVSDHGFGSATGIFSVKEHNRELLTGNHRPDGIFLATGPDIQAGRIDGLTIMDVFPALAYLSGLPVADDLPGDLDLGLFTDSRLEEVPPSYTRAYTSTATSVEVTETASQQAQEDNVKSLQGLGYVGESFELGETDTQAFDFWASQNELIIQHLVGEVSLYLIKGDAETANAVLVEARMHNDKLPLRIIARSRQALQSIRDSINKQAVPDSAFAFIRSARASEVNRAKQQKAEAGQ